MRLPYYLLRTLLRSLLVLSMTVTNAAAQQATSEQWWPHPLWGADDQAGGSNWITPKKVLEAISLVETGKIYELGHVYERGMPLAGQRTFALFSPSFPTGGPFADDLVYNDELLVAEIGQVGTQFDGPGHIGKRITADNGAVTDVFYNGIRDTDMKGPYGLRKLGIENVGPYVTRGILVDAAGYRGVETLPAGYVVTLDDVRGALQRQGMSEEDIEPGDAILFNYGWWRHWPDSRVVSSAPPGIGRAVADWIIERRASMVGSDAQTDETEQWVVHEELILKNGIFNLEFMNFEGLLADEVHEFLFVFTPLRLRGATGSPGRPLAIR